MKNIGNKFLSGIVGISAFALSCFPSFGQDSTSVKQEVPKNNWNWSFTLCSLYPHDSDLKDIFGSYISIQPEAQRKIGKDIYLGVNGNLGWSHASGENIDVYATTKEMTAIFEYRFGENEKSTFALGAGPKISGLNLKLDETFETTNQSGSLATKTETTREKYSGLGYMARMKYTFKISKSLALFAQASYSKVKDEEENLSLGTTGIAFGIQF